MIDETVLFLDLSLEVGWVFGRRGQNSIPRWGVWRLPRDGDLPRIFNAFENILLDSFEEFRPSRIGVERPIPQRTNNVVTAELTYGLHAILALRCYQHEIPLSRPAVGTIRAKVCGRAKRTELERAAKIDVKTAIVMPWISSMGWQEITSDDARDAAAGWAFETGVRAARTGQRGAV